MGYDVSFHPISPEEMREWYFTPLTWIQQGQEEKVLALAARRCLIRATAFILR